MSVIIPFLPRAGGKWISAAGKRPGREQQRWGAQRSFLSPCARGHSLPATAACPSESGPDYPATLLPSARKRGTTPESFAISALHFNRSTDPPLPWGNNASQALVPGAPLTLFLDLRNTEQPNHTLECC